MTFLPSARQKERSPRRGTPARDEAERSLVRAFAAFAQAADSLEKSYGQLQDELARLGGGLERANSKLTRSLEENTRVRSFLAQSQALSHLRRLLEPFLPRVVVLSPREIPPGISVQSPGVVR